MVSMIISQDISHCKEPLFSAGAAGPPGAAAPGLRCGRWSAAGGRPSAGGGGQRSRCPAPPGHWRATPPAGGGPGRAAPPASTPPAGRPAPPGAQPA